MQFQSYFVFHKHSIDCRSCSIWHYVFDYGKKVLDASLLLVVRNTATHHNTLAYYLTVSAFGTVLITISLTSPIIYAPFPPFATAAWSFLGLSSYLYSVGFYFSTISIAQDAKLRQSIRDIAAKESKLLDSIGTAHMEQEVQKKVLKIAKEQEKTLEKQTGVELHEWQQ